MLREIGNLAAELWTLRQLSLAVAAGIDDGRNLGFSRQHSSRTLAPVLNNE